VYKMAKGEDRRSYTLVQREKNDRPDYDLIYIFCVPTYISYHARIRVFADDDVDPLGKHCTWG